MKEMLKWPLILAAVVVVLRVVTERAGAPESVNNVLSVVALHALLAPLYFAVLIARSGDQKPYTTLFKLVAAYVVLARIMVLPTYWLARVYEWTQPRFYGLWGDGVSPFFGYILLPFATAAFWIGASIVVGGGLGSIVIAVGRRFFPVSASTGAPSPY